MELHADSTEDMGRVQTVFWTAHRELQETTDLTVQYFGMHHANMVRNVVAGLQEGLHQDQSPIATTATLSEPQEHVANVVQSIQ